MIHPDRGGCCPFLLNLAHEPTLGPCAVRAFKCTTVHFKKAAALDSSSPKWWPAPELHQPVQAVALHRCQLLPPPAGTSLSRLLPPGLGLGVTAELGLPNCPTVARALAQLRPGQPVTAGTALPLSDSEGLLCISRLCWWNVCVLGHLYVDVSMCS